MPIMGTHFSQGAPGVGAPLNLRRTGARSGCGAGWHRSPIPEQPFLGNCGDQVVITRYADATATCARRPVHHPPACGFLRHAAANLGLNDGLSFLVNTPSRARSSAAGEGDPLSDRTGVVHVRGIKGRPC